MELTTEQKTTLLREMLRIRRLEERIDSEYLKDQMRTPVHLCIGQEAIAVGACQALRRNDVISSNHRGHGHYIAKGGNMKSLVAELYSRSTGCSKGYGGSMHIIDPSVGHLGSSSIVGGGIPIGTGHALAFKIRHEDHVSLVFFGDGASEEGVLYESIHFAVLKRLPAIFVLENNGLAICSPISNRQRLPSIFHQGYPSEALTSSHIDGNDVEEVYTTVNAAVKRARQGHGPSFIECMTYRVTGHSGCKAQDPAGYREQVDMDAGLRTCPIKRYRRQLLDDRIVSEDVLSSLEIDIEKEVDDAFVFAQNSPLPDPKDALKYVFYE